MYPRRLDLGCVRTMSSKQLLQTLWAQPGRHLGSLKSSKQTGQDNSSMKASWTGKDAIRNVSFAPVKFINHKHHRTRNGKTGQCRKNVTLFGFTFLCEICAHSLVFFVKWTSLIWLVDSRLLSSQGVPNCGRNLSIQTATIRNCQKNFFYNSHIPKIKWRLLCSNSNQRWFQLHVKNAVKKMNDQLISLIPVGKFAEKNNG